MIERKISLYLKEFFSKAETSALLVTGARQIGKSFAIREFGKSQFKHFVEINEKGDSYRIVWGLVNGGRPTSEFPSHFMNHSVRVAATNGATRVIYHAHPANVIAMTYVLPLTDRDFSRALWKSATECPVVFPGGVGVVPWMVPGGSDIAMATCEKMKEFEAGYLDAGFGEPSMRGNLHRWMMEYAVLHGLPPEKARQLYSLLYELLDNQRNENNQYQKGASQ